MQLCVSSVSLQLCCLRSAETACQWLPIIVHFLEEAEEEEEDTVAVDLYRVILAPSARLSAS